MITRSTIPLAAMLALFLPAAPAQALSFKTFVSSTGSGTVCSFAAPCNNFQDAHDATDARGQIACLDSGDFTGAHITKTITIDCAGTSATAAGLTISGAGVFVRIRNLTLAQASVGIDFSNAAALFVENCVIRNMNPLAIRFRPAGLGAQLVVSDTIIINNGASSNGGGIQVAPQPGGSAGVVLNRVTFEVNVTAIVLNSSSGGIGAVMTDSVVSSFSNGILSIGGQGVNLTIRNSKLINNVGAAIQSDGANSVVRLDESTIAGNQTGVSAINGGVVQSFKNNRIIGNQTDGIPIPAVPGYSGTMQ